MGCCIYYCFLGGLSTAQKQIQNKGIIMNVYLYAGASFISSANASLYFPKAISNALIVGPNN